MPLVVTKPCEMCGKEMQNVNCKRKYCTDCQRIRDAQRSALYRAKHGATPRCKTLIQKPPTFDSAAKEMVALGFGANYAAYQAYKIKEGSPK